MATTQSDSRGSKLFRSKQKNVQFWVSDLMKTFQKENDPGNEWIVSVSVMGTVTDVFGPASDDYPSNRPFKYDLDDGTGVIKVVYFPKSRSRNDVGADRGKLPDSSSRDCSNPGFLSLLGRTEMLSRRPFPVGSCIQASGRVKFYRGNVEILAYQVRLVPEPRLEVERMLRLCQSNKKNLYPLRKP